MDVSGFYGVTAQVAFTLLGLWWVVVQFKHAEWTQSRRHRRMAYDVSLLFLLVGVMSLMAMVDPNGSVLWRIAFGVGAILGGVETALLSSTVIGSGRASRGAHLMTLVVYGLVLVLALDPRLPRQTGLHVKGLQLEGILVAFLLFLGVNMSWLRFAALEPTS